MEGAPAAPAVPAAAPNIDDDASTVSDDPAFDRLFGRDADGAPLWLRTEELLRIDDGGNVDDDDGDNVDENGDENKGEETSDGGKKKKSKDAFDAEAYIAEAKKLVPLEALSSELKDYLGTLKSKLVDVLNSDYDDFIALSSDLTDVDAAAAAARAPLRRLRARLAAAASDVEARRGELRQALAERGAASAARAALELVRDAAAAAEKLDAALVEAGLPAASAVVSAGEGAGGEVGPGEEAADSEAAAAAADSAAAASSPPPPLSIPPPPDAPLEDVLRSLEHCAAAASRLEDLCARAREAPLAAALAPAAARARGTLAAALRGALAAALEEERGEKGAGGGQPSSSSSSSSAAVHCLQCFSSLGEGRAAEDAVASFAVAPALSEAFRKTMEEKREREKEKDKEGGGDSSPSSFSLDASDVPAVLENLRGALDARAGPLLRAVAAAAASAASSSSSSSSSSSPFLPLRSLALLPRSVVSAVARSVLEAFPGALSPGRPDELVASYEAAEAFVAWVDESFAFGGAPNSATATTAANSTAVAVVPRAAGSAEAREFLGRWPLQAYFGLRLQEVGFLLEDALAVEEEEQQQQQQEEGEGGGVKAAAAAAKGPFDAAADDDDGGVASSFSSSVALPSHPLSLRASAGLARSLSRLASKGVLVRPLADRFCGLALRLCERHAGWLREGAAAREREARRRAGGSGGEGDVAVPSPSSSAPPPSVEALCAAASDASAVAAWMRAGEFSVAMADAVRGGAAGESAPAAPAAVAATAAAVARAAAKLDAAAAAALSAAGASLGLAAAPKLQQQLRGVVATYRMTPRPPPTRPSPYAAAALAEARAAVAAVAEEEQRRSKEGARSRSSPSSLLAAAAVSAVSGAFADTAADVLDAVRRTESSLRRLKNKGAGAGGAGAGAGAEAAAGEAAATMTDADKIAAQILLDVAAFGKAGRELGCGDLASLPEFRRLWAVAAGGASEEGGKASSGGEHDFDVERVLAEAAARQQQQQTVAPSPPPPPPPAAPAAGPSMGTPP